MLMTARFHLAAVATVTVLLTACSASDRSLLGPGPPGIRPAQIKTLSVEPIKGAAARFAFQPMSGAPAEMLFALEDLIKEQAVARNINLVEPGDPTATYIVRGYISAVGDPHSALMVYVWDVFDTSGTRIHRFSGQETAPGSGSDPWSGVTRDIMADAARETIDSMAEWIRE